MCLPMMRKIQIAYVKEYIKKSCHEYRDCFQKERKDIAREQVEQMTDYA